MEEFATERKSIYYDKKTIKNIVNRILTIQKKDYYRKDKVDEYPESETIVIELSKRVELSFKVIVRYLFDSEAHKHGKKITGDQTPRHVFYILEIKKMFPEALFINMIRDSRGLLLSQKYKWKAGIRKKVPLFEAVRTHFNYHPFLMSIMWRKGIEKSISVDENIKQATMINIKFEDLTNHPEKTIRSVCDFLGVQSVDLMLDVMVSMSSTSTDEDKRGTSQNVAVAKRWIDKLAPTDIYVAEK
jgi:hypothetical protein